MTDLEKLKQLRGAFEELYQDKDLTHSGGGTIVDYQNTETHDLWTAFVLGWKVTQYD